MVKKMNISLRNQSFYLDYSRGYEKSKDMSHDHLHQDYEILYLLEGEKNLYMNGETYVIRKNNLLFIDKNILHKTKVIDHHYQRIVINFRDNFLLEGDEPMVSALFNQTPLLLTVSSEQQFQPLMESMLKEYNLNHQGRHRYLQLLLSQFLMECHRLFEAQAGSLKKVSSQPKNELIDDIITYINENFHKDITLSLLSDKFFVHEQSISKLFSKTLGCSFTQYINAVRTAEAQRLLLETQLKINQVIRKAGYTNHVHFWRIFKKFTGFSPNEYRKQHAMK